MSIATDASQLDQKRAAAQKLQDALRRLEAIRVKASKAAAKVHAMRAAADSAARNREITVLIRLGRFLVERANLDAGFARYCVDGLGRVSLSPYETELMRPMIGMLARLGERTNSPTDNGGGETENQDPGEDT
jgi:hypothetical protein